MSRLPANIQLEHKSEPDIANRFPLRLTKHFRPAGERRIRYEANITEFESSVLTF